MSRFFVGCPVRLAHPLLPKNAGAEGHITRFGEWPKGTLTNTGNALPIDCDCAVKWHTVLHDERAAHTSQLEPIIPEGMRPTTWEKCLWQPQKSLVTT